MMDTHLSDNIARLKLAQSLDVLGDGSLVIALAVEMVSVPTMDIGQSVLADRLRLSDAESEREVRLGEQMGKLGR